MRDASGNVMAIYEDTRPINTNSNDNIAIKEIPIYGSSRLGQYRPKTDAKKTALGQRIYEFSNHLGNVLVTLTDNKVPQTDGTYESVVVSASDYYPFGMAMSERTYSNSEYRYGFNGKEKDWDIAVGKTDFGARIYDELTGRWFSLDQYTKPHQSDYVFATDNPIIFIDPDGRDDFYFDKQARTWHIIPTGAPHRFITFINISDGEGGTIESIRPMTDSEVGAALYRNNELYVRAMQSAYTPENAGRLRYLRAEYFGLTSVNLSHRKARPIIYIIGGLIALPIAAEVLGEAALAEFLLEETGEYVLEEAGVPVPIINDPTDLVEYAFKKGSKKTIYKGGKGTLGTGITKGKYSGRDFDPSKAGGEILNLDWKSAKIQSSGIDVVKKHLSRFDHDDANVKMVDRLKKISEGKMKATDYDKRFYTHEIREYERYKALGVKDGVDPGYDIWNDAHTGTLEDFKIDELKEPLYHPDVD